jgi:hypothetical protein
MIIAQRTSVDEGSQDSYPWLKHQLTWSFDHTRHLIRCAYYVERDSIFRDLFTKLERFAKEQLNV